MNTAHRWFLLNSGGGGASQASNLTISSFSANKIDSVSWTRGTGQYCMLVGKIGSEVDSLPVNGVTYTADFQFGLGSEIGTGNFVLYKGTASSMPTIISGLSPQDDLHLRIFEFNGKNGSEVYMTDTADNNPINQVTSKSYKQRVLDLSPIAYWPLDETSGSTADNAEGTAALDATYGGATGVTFGENIFKNGNPAPYFPSGSAFVNCYSADFNTAMNKNEGTISMWFKVPGDNWASGPERLLYFYVNTSNRFIIQTATTNLTIFRTAGGTAKSQVIDLSAKPTGWQHIAVTYSVSGDAFKVYLNGVQVGATQTGNGTWSGNLGSTTTVIGATDTSGTNDINNKLVAHVAVFNTPLSDSNILELATAPYETYLTSEYKEWNLYSLFSETGNSQMRFLRDIDGDGEPELICNIGQSIHCAALKLDNSIVWEINEGASQAAFARQPQLVGDNLYFTDLAKIYCVNVYTGALVWEKTKSTGKMVSSNIGLVIAASNTTVDVLDYDTGESLGGNWPHTVATNISWPQSIAAGDLDSDGYDEVFVNDDGGNLYAIDHDGTAMFTISEDHSHYDWITVADVDEDGNQELVLVVDTDNSTGGLSEGDEIAIYSHLGVIKDSYTPGVGTTVRVKDIAGTGKIIFCNESSPKVGVLDSSLSSVWEITPPLPYQGGQLTICDLDGDGQLEIIVNTGENPEYGFRVWDEDGVEKLFFANGAVELDNWVDSKGWTSPQYDQGRLGSVENYLAALGRNNDTVEEAIYWHRLRLKTIPTI